MSKEEQNAQPPVLLPEHRHVLEDLIRVADAEIGSLHGLARLQTERTRDLAAVILHALGPDGTVDERGSATRLLEAANPGSKWTDDRVPRTPEERRHHQAKRLGRAAVLGWLGHSAAAPAVTAAESALRALVEPLGMPDQLTVTQVTARFLGATAFWPDGSEWSNPFAGAPAELIREAQRIQPLYLAALRELANRIALGGAALDPNDDGVLIVLAQLTLLEVDLTRPASELVDELNILPPGWIDREAATLGHPASGSSRHGATARFMTDLSASARFLARLHGPPPIPTPYGSGEKRRSPMGQPAQIRRRSALAKVLRSFPDVNAAALRRTWGADAATAGGLLRRHMGRDPDDRPPSETTLRKDLREIG
jgi:hypothetical protein